MNTEYINKRKEIIDQIKDPVIRLREINKLADEIELENLRLRIEITEREIETSRAKTEREIEASRAKRQKTANETQVDIFQYLPFTILFGSIITIVIIVLSNL